MRSQKLKDFAFVAVLCVISPAIAEAVPTFQVNSTADLVDDDVTDGVCHTSAGTCTLRAAVMQANKFSAQGSVINLPAGTYTLTRPILGSDGDSEGNLNFTGTSNPNSFTTINGVGANLTIIDADQIDNVFTVDASTSVYISGVTLRNGSASFGGCIFNHGTLTLQNSVVTNCSAFNFGGAIFNDFLLTLVGSTVSSSQAQNGVGGGIANELDVTLVNSSIVNNSAETGGGVSSENGAINAINSTIAGNTANNGGGLYEGAKGATRLYNVTVAFNYSPRDQTQNYGSAGLSNIGNSSTIDLYNSIVAANFDLYNRADYDCDGPLRVNARDLLGVVSVCDSQGCSPTGIEGCPLTVAGIYTQLNSPSYLGSLADNGGPTPTIALVSGSNAINYGDPASGCKDQNGQQIVDDQRGYKRPAGGICDVGAFEYGAVAPDDIFQNGFQ